MRHIIKPRLIIEPAPPTADQLRDAARAFFARATVYGDDDQFQVTAWTPEAMDAARLLYDLAFAPTSDELATLAASPARPPSEEER